MVCDGDPPHVSRIVLVNNNLVGTLPLELRDLDDLAILDVRNNRISGEIPSTIAGLPIGTLRLAGNWMTGSIHAICGLSQVIDVDLTRNYFSGPVPSCIQHLTGLRTLDLVTANAPDNNNFDEGPLPTWLLDLPALQYLSLGQVSGTIPEWIEQLNGLRAFGLVRSPNLTCRILSEIGQMALLQGLDLRVTGVNGPLPAAICNLTGLERVLVTAADLSGPIPPCLGSMESLTHLWLQANMCTGEIPPELGNLNQLDFLYSTEPVRGVDSRPPGDPYDASRALPPPGGSYPP